MLIREVYNNFSLPIELNKHKRAIFNNLYSDLELLECSSETDTSVYEHVFLPVSAIGKQCIVQWTKYYTTDKAFITDSQKLYKSIDKFSMDPKIKITAQKAWKKWIAIKESDNFLEKFQYIEWEKMQVCNTSEQFLAVLTFYSIASPVLNLLTPVILLIIPFLVLKIMKVPITVKSYVDVLLQQLDRHSIGQIFTRFKDFSWHQRVYLIMCFGMYLYNIYQNVVSCYHFYLNTTEINSFFQIMTSYLGSTRDVLGSYMEVLEHLPAYDEYSSYLRSKLNDIVILHETLKKVPVTSFNVFKIFSLGKTMKEFYLIRTCGIVEKILLFTFGFHGYIETLEGLNKNIKSSKIKPIRIKKSSTPTLKLKKSYHPSISEGVVTNDIDLNTNKIVTGPNAAGKTTILKSTIINVLLSQQVGYGFYKSGRLTPFDYIHCYLNIPDTNARDSLFQAEARRCQSILRLIDNHPKKKHFCIFDELYSGTNPYEAIATAHAYLTYISNNRNVKFMLTTHYIRLCKLFEKNTSITNCNMETHMDDMCPKYTYKMIKGISEIKGGVSVLRQLEYPEEILSNAKKIIDEL